VTFLDGTKAVRRDVPACSEITIRGGNPPSASAD
jgi:hypothetical protein